MVVLEKLFGHFLHSEMVNYHGIWQLHSWLFILNKRKLKDAMNLYMHAHILLYL